MRSDSSSNFTGKLDKTAVALSGLCLVHCLLLPLFIAVFPILGFTVVSHETFHQLILLLVIPTTVIALGMGYRRHHSRVVATLGLAGVAALVVAAFAVHELGTEALERGVTVAGGLLLAAAHLRNFRLTRAGHDHGHHLATAAMRKRPAGEP
ncbi:MerC domain-containing protein [Salinisphaera aquimarina]|uniref:MerC domain-containing protein n=1 Tax=Salinisphaera aquimarina TaxID=2094031 RepID=A0ABV7EQ99_9GAMM